MPFEEWGVQITLLQRFWIPPPVPPLAHRTKIPELSRIIKREKWEGNLRSCFSIKKNWKWVSGNLQHRRRRVYLSVCISEVGVIAVAFHLIWWLGLIRNQTQKTRGKESDLTNKAGWTIPCCSKNKMFTCSQSYGLLSSRQTLSGLDFGGERSWANQNQTACCLEKGHQRTVDPLRGLWRGKKKLHVRFLTLGVAPSCDVITATEVIKIKIYISFVSFNIKHNFEYIINTHQSYFRGYP